MLPDRYQQKHLAINFLFNLIDNSQLLIETNENYEAIGDQAFKDGSIP